MSFANWANFFASTSDARIREFGDAVAAAVRDGDGLGLREELTAELLRRAGLDAVDMSAVHSVAVAEEERSDERAFESEESGAEAERRRHFAEARTFGGLREITADVDDDEALSGALYELLYALDGHLSELEVALGSIGPRWARLLR